MATRTSYNRFELRDGRLRHVQKPHENELSGLRHALRQAFTRILLYGG
jgi:hypothetical protein